MGEKSPGSTPLPPSSAALMRAPAQLNAILETVGEAVIAVDETQTIILVNRALEATWGYERDELLGNSVHMLMPPEYVAAHDAAFFRRLSQGRADGPELHVETEGLHKDGHRFPVELRFTTVEVDGQLLVTATARDISRRKAGQAELKRSSDLLQATLDATADGILCMDLDGSVAAYNARLHEIWQIDEDLTQLPVKERLAVISGRLLDPGAYASTLEADSETETPRVFATTDGRFIERTIRVLRSDRAFQGRVASFRDVTSRELALRALQRRVEFDRLTTSISARFINIDAEDISLAIDEALEKVGRFSGADRCYLLVFDKGSFDAEQENRAFGIAHEWALPEVAKLTAAQGKAVAKLDPETKQRAANWFRQRMIDRESICICSLHELPPEGEAVKARLEAQGVQSLAVVPVVSASESIGILGLDTVTAAAQWDADLVENLETVGYVFANAIVRQRGALALREAHDKLERKVDERTRELREKHAQLAQSEKLAALGQLVAGVAHEVNTPLGAIKSNNDTLSRTLQRVERLVEEWDDAAPKKVSRLMRGAATLTTVNHDAIERITKIVGSLRRFARLDQAEVDSVDLHDGLDSTLTLLHHELRARIHIEREYGDLPHVECYPNQLNQVFMNLLMNAAQAIEGKGTITIRTSRVDDEVLLEFQDTGRGIQPEHLGRIFDPGFTTKGVGVGTGLGLSIVHRIVQQHQGRLDVSSTVGVGTTFKLWLPIHLHTTQH